MALSKVPKKTHVKPAQNKSKGLQKFTEIKSKDQIKAYLDQPGPEYKKLYDHLIHNCRTDLRFMQEVFDHGDHNIQSSGCFDLENNNELLLYFLESLSQNVPCEENQELNETHRRDIYSVNREIILRLYRDFVISKGKLPAITNISALTGLSRTTVTKHFKDLKNEGYLQDILDGSYILVDSVLAHLYKIGIETNDVKALKTFLDWHKDKAARILQQNFLQFNNLVISAEAIKALPKEKLIQIEEVIRSNTII